MPSSLVPKIGLDGVRRPDADDLVSEAASGPAGPRLGSTSPRPERRARQLAAASGADAAARRSGSHDAGEHAAQLRDRRDSLRRAGSTSQAPWGDGDDAHDCARAGPALPPVSRACYVHEYEAWGPQRSAAESQVTALCINHRGDIALWGDRGGRMFLPERTTSVVSRGTPLQCYVQRSAYVPFVDPLHSVDIAPAITAAAFVPQVGPTQFFLTCNERIPKLWKLTHSDASCATPFRAVDKIGDRTVGGLTGSQPSASCIEVGAYNIDHEYRIHSVLPSPDGQHFITVDDLSVRLWATEVTHLSMELLSVKPPEGDVRESFTAAAASARDPTLVMCCTTAGYVRVFDTRCGLRMSAEDEMQGAAMVLRNPPRAHDGDFSHVGASVLGCAATPCGHYIIGRDFMSVNVWDVRMAGGAKPGDGNAPGATPAPTADGAARSLTRRWLVHPHMHAALNDVYQAGMLFQAAPVALLNDGRRWVTGSFNGRIVSGSLNDDAALVTAEQLIADAEGTAGGAERSPSDVDAGDAGTSSPSSCKFVPYAQRFNGAEDTTTARRAEFRGAQDGGVCRVSASAGSTSGEEQQPELGTGPAVVSVCAETNEVFVADGERVVHGWLE